MLSFYDKSGMAEDLGGTPATAAPPVTTEVEKVLSPTQQPQSTQDAREPAPDLDVPAAIAELRKADPARVMYEASGMHAEIHDDLDTLVSAAVVGEQRKATVAEMQEVVSDLGATHGDVRTFLSAASILASKPPTADEETRMQQQCLQQLRDRFGEEADAAAADARRLVARDPRFAEWIEATGLGNHPATVVRIAELARSERSRGRLK